MRRLNRQHPAAAATPGAAAPAAARGANAAAAATGAGINLAHGTNTPINGGRPNVVQGWAYHYFIFSST